MTSRVFDCQGRLPFPVVPVEPPGGPRATTHGFTAATLTALVLVPVAGAAEQPQGWTAGTLAALGVLLLVPLSRGRAPWGWIALVAALLGLGLPRGQLGFLGPALLVITVLCCVLWFANRGGKRGPLADQQPFAGSAVREAQQMMGLFGERYVAQALARELPEEFVLINSLKLPRGAGDIDHVVVGPSGVFLLETKTMVGRIECDADGNWHRTRKGRGGISYPAHIGNPAAQVQRNILAARNCLKARVPNLVQGTSLWLEGLVVFPHPRTELVTGATRVPALRLEEVTARICSHVPRRNLQPKDVDQIVDALLIEGRERREPVVASAQSAQALVEAALVLPIILAMLFGTVALSRLIQAQTAVVAVAHEAARAGALANAADHAPERMQRRVELVAPGLGLDPRAVILDWDVSTFTRAGGRVVAVVRYPVDLRDLPIAGSAPTLMVQAEHVEWVDPFRSGIDAQGSDGP